MKTCLIILKKLINRNVKFKSGHFKERNPLLPSISNKEELNTSKTVSMNVIKEPTYCTRLVIYIPTFNKESN